MASLKRHSRRESTNLIVINVDLVVLWLKYG